MIPLFAFVVKSEAGLRSFRHIKRTIFNFLCHISATVSMIMALSLIIFDVHGWETHILVAVKSVVYIKRGLPQKFTVVP